MKQARSNREVAGGDRATVMVVVVLGGITLATALAVVHSRHEARNLFVELEALKKVRDDVAIEWDRLQLEEGTFATASRIEQSARTRLDMVTPQLGAAAPADGEHPQLEYVKP